MLWPPLKPLSKTVINLSQLSFTSLRVVVRQVGGGGPQGDHPVGVRVHREDVREAPPAQRQRRQHQRCQQTRAPCERRTLCEPTRRPLTPPLCQSGRLWQRLNSGSASLQKAAEVTSCPSSLTLSGCVDSALQIPSSFSRLWRMRSDDPEQPSFCVLLQSVLGSGGTYWQRHNIYI